MNIPLRHWKLIGAVVCALLISRSASANSKFLNVQGTLTDSSGNPLSGTQTVTFRLYTSSTAAVGSNIWNESDSLTLSTGIFNLTLGNTTTLDSLTFNQLYYLGIQVAGDANELSPRQPLGASAYAQGSLGNFTVGGSATVAGTFSVGYSTFVVTASSVGILTIAPATTLDVNGSAQFGAGVSKSTFSMTPGNTSYALSISSGINMAAGTMNLGSNTLCLGASCITSFPGNGWAETTYTTQYSTTVLTPNTLIVFDGESTMTVTISTYGAAWTSGSQIGLINNSTDYMIVVSSPEWITDFTGYSTQTTAGNQALAVPPWSSWYGIFTEDNETITWQPNNNPTFVSFCQPGTITYSSPGSFATFLMPNGCNIATIQVIGGGGGGGQCNSCNEGGSGGSGGGIAGGTWYLAPGASYSVGVGSGGVAGATSSGGNGGQSYFSTLAVASGGSGGVGGGGAVTNVGTGTITGSPINPYTAGGGAGGAQGVCQAYSGGGGGGAPCSGPGGLDGYCSSNYGGNGGSCPATIPTGYAGGAGGTYPAIGANAVGPGAGGGGGADNSGLGGSGGYGQVTVSWGITSYSSPANLYVLGGWTSFGSQSYTSNNVVVESTLTVQGNAFSVGASAFVVAASSVGVNLTSGSGTPQAQLDVNGTAQFGAGANKSTFTYTGGLTLSSVGDLTARNANATYGVNAATGVYTGTGATLYSITTSSGISVGAGTLEVAGPAQFTYGTNAGGYSIFASSGINSGAGVQASWFNGTYYGTWAGATVANATTATNLAGGSQYNVPYQTGSGATGFISNGNTGNVLTYGTSGPVWQAPTGGSGAGGGSWVETTYTTQYSTTVNSPNTLIIFNGISTMTVNISTYGAAWAAGSQIGLINNSTDYLIVASAPEWITDFTGYSTQTTAGNQALAVPPWSSWYGIFSVANATITWQPNNNPNFAAICKPGSQTYSAPGVASTFIMPQGCNVATIQLWGGGGGTGYCNSCNEGTAGGAGGGAAYGVFTLPPGSYTVFVGTGGAAGVSGTNGGQSYFESGTTPIISATGGAGSASGQQSNTTIGTGTISALYPVTNASTAGGGIGGAASAGQAYQGGGGGGGGCGGLGGINDAGYTADNGGKGGACLFGLTGGTGGEGGGGSGGGASPTNGAQPGGGAGAGSDNAGVGANGGYGQVIVSWGVFQYSSPGLSYLTGGWSLSGSLSYTPNNTTVSVSTQASGTHENLNPINNGLIVSSAAIIVAGSGVGTHFGSDQFTVPTSSVSNCALAANSAPAVNGSDMNGSLSWTSTVSGICMEQINFAAGYQSKPKAVIITPGGINQFMSVLSVGATYFDVISTGTSGNTSQSFYYFVTQ